MIYWLLIFANLYFAIAELSIINFIVFIVLVSLEIAARLLIKPKGE